MKEMLQEIMQEMKRDEKNQQKEIAGKQVSVKVPEQKNKPVQQRD